MCAENKNNRQNVYKFIIQLTGILAGAILLGFVLLVLAYMLPTERMRQNVAATAEQINTEGQYYQWAKGYKNAQTDTYTDASLLLNAMYPGSGSAVRDAMNAPRLLYGDDNNEASVVLLANGDTGETHEVCYGRYWHGSLILLKPLLLLFDLGDIRMISMIIQMGLLFVVIMGFCRRQLYKELTGFFGAIITLNPVTMIFGWCFSIEYVLMLLMTAILLYFHEYLQKGYNYYLYFLINGILFVYFNELSFPMIGFAIPLIIYLLLSKEKVKEKIKKEVVFGMLWGVGYAVVWLGKWILAWIFTGYNYFKEAIEQAERYTSDHATWEVENPTLIDRLVKNLNMYMKWPFLMMAIVLLGIICVSMIRKHAKITGENLVVALPYLLVCLLPFAVFTVLGNGYSYVHYWFTHRLLAISVFSGITMLFTITGTKENHT